jgi:hypothetical protein
VAKKLGLLPLALNQAGSFVSQKQISFQKYLTLFDGNFETVTRGASNLPPDRQDERSTILTTWEVSFDSLSDSAKELLLLCGFLANGDIPDELFDMDTKARFGWMGEGKTISSISRLPVSDTQQGVTGSWTRSARSSHSL